MTHRVLAAAIGAAALLSTLAPDRAAADAVQLKYAYPGAPQAAVYTNGIVPWVKAVEEASGGALQIKLFPGMSLSAPNNVYDRVINGVADFGFLLLGLYPQQFPKTTVAMLPYAASNPHEAGVAMWRLYEKGVFADELSKIKPIALEAFTNMSVHTHKPVHSMDDLRGLKVATMSRTLGEVIHELGGTPITMPPTEFYQSLKRGTVDAAGIGWPGIMPFKLYEVTKFHLQASLSAEGAMNFMNKASYARLPEAGKKAIDKLAGLPFCEMMARAIASMDDQGLAQTKKLNQTITELSPEEEKRWRKATDAVIAAWEKKTPNGPQVLAAFRKEIVEIRAGK